MSIRTPFGDLNIPLREFEFEVSPKKHMYSMDGFWIEHPVRVLMKAYDGPLEIVSIFNPEDSFHVDLDEETLKLVTTEAKLRSNFALDHYRASAHIE